MSKIKAVIFDMDGVLKIGTSIIWNGDMII